jgi:3-oxoacyl-[acyl-carrier-protein] synthase II
MKTTELAVTGIGCITGLGVGVAAFERGLFDGCGAIGPVTEFDTGAARAHVAGRLDDFDPAAFIAPARLRRVDRTGQLASAGARLALEHAGMGDGTAVSRDRVGIALGSATAGLHTLVDYLDRLIAQGPLGASALDFSNTVGNAAASVCALELALRGVTLTLAHREASGLAAISRAATTLQAGRADAMLAGGVDDFEQLYFLVHDRFGALATDAGEGEASRPFDRRRNGVVLGRGACLLVLEPVTAAERRGATLLARMLATSETSAPCDLHGWPPTPEPFVRCMRQALERAGVKPDDVAVVLASANSSRALDRLEAEAIASIFGPRGVPVVALKGALGECGASGAAGVAAAVLSIQRRTVPPTVGLCDVDPACAVDAGPRARAMDPGRSPVALVNAFATGGTNVSAVLSA